VIQFPHPFEHFMLRNGSPPISSHCEIVFFFVRRQQRCSRSSMTDLTDGTKKKRRDRYVGSHIIKK